VLDPAKPEQVRQGDVLLHPIGPGEWRVIRQQEMLGDAWRPVAD
jgi:sarcosine oxidase gamma subunit